MPLKLGRIEIMTNIIYQKKQKNKNKARVFNYITNKINFTKQEIS